LASGIQKKLPTPCIKAVVEKKYEALPIAVTNACGSTAGLALGKKSMVVETRAMAGPAARKLHIIMAMQMTVAM
jgi:hypothetical protein